jgi:hypothetical protein
MTLPLELRREIDRVLLGHGLTPREVHLISLLGELKGKRFAYRVDLADGRRVKARHFGTEAAARRVFELHAGLEEAFARVVAQDGAVLIEEWIEGTALGEREAETHAEAAGAMLGRLHRTRLGAHIPPTAGTRRWREAAEADLALLGGAGHLTPRDVASLGAELARRDPGDAGAVFLHRDYQVPMLSCPLFSDQPALARRCQELGLAVPLTSAPGAPVEPEGLRAALRRVTDGRSAFAARLAEARSWELRTIGGRPEILDRLASIEAAGVAPR